MGRFAFPHSVFACSSDSSGCHSWPGLGGLWLDSWAGFFYLFFSFLWNHLCKTFAREPWLTVNRAHSGCVDLLAVLLDFRLLLVWVYYWLAASRRRSDHPHGCWFVQMVSFFRAVLQSNMIPQPAPISAKWSSKVFTLLGRSVGFIIAKNVFVLAKRPSVSR